MRGGGASGEKNTLEILRLLREIHAAVCNAKKEAPKHKQRYVLPGHIARLMVDDRPYSALEIHQKLISEGLNFKQVSISILMTKLAKDGKITRLQRSLFQRLPHPKEGE